MPTLLFGSGHDESNNATPPTWGNIRVSGERGQAHTEWRWEGWQNDSPTRVRSKLADFQVACFPPFESRIAATKHKLIPPHTIRLPPSELGLPKAPRERSCHPRSRAAQGLRYRSGLVRAGHPLLQLHLVSKQQQLDVRLVLGASPSSEGAANEEVGEREQAWVFQRGVRIAAVPE
jgi:hypothetical protein